MGDKSFAGGGSKSTAAFKYCDWEAGKAREVGKASKMDGPLRPVPKGKVGWKN
jgi:hypothetical protein